MKIEAGKKYKTRGGEIAEVTEINQDNLSFSVSVIIRKPKIITLTKRGTYFYSKIEHELDLVEEIKEEKGFSLKFDSTWLVKTIFVLSHICLISISLLGAFGYFDGYPLFFLMPIAALLVSLLFIIFCNKDLK